MKGLTVVSAAMRVVAGVRGRSVAPQAGIALTVRVGGVTRGPSELGWAVAGTDGAITGQKPATNCEGRKKFRRLESTVELHEVFWGVLMKWYLLWE